MLKRQARKEVCRASNKDFQHQLRSNQQNMLDSQSYQIKFIENPSKKVWIQSVNCWRIRTWKIVINQFNVLDWHYETWGQKFARRKWKGSKHKSSFNSENKCSATALSKYLWELKRQGIVHSVEWKVIAKCQPYRCGTRRCNLCLTEKMFILMSKERLLNKNSELLQKCRHSNKYKLGKIT